MYKVKNRKEVKNTYPKIDIYKTGTKEDKSNMEVSRATNYVLALIKIQKEKY